MRHALPDSSTPQLAGVPLELGDSSTWLPVLVCCVAGATQPLSSMRLSTNCHQTADWDLLRAHPVRAELMMPQRLQREHRLRDRGWHCQH